MRTVLRCVIASVVVALSVGVPWGLYRRSQAQRLARGQALEQQASRLSLLVEQDARGSARLAQAEATPALSGPELGELLRLRNERRWLGEQTNRLARLANGAAPPNPASPAELQAALADEIAVAMKRILPLLQPALQGYALSHSNQPPNDLSDLQDYLPRVADRKMPGLDIIEFVRGEAPKPGDALLLRGGIGRAAADGSVVRVYGFSDERVVQVSSDDGHFDAWEAQYLRTLPAAREENFRLESTGTAPE